MLADKFLKFQRHTCKKQLRQKAESGPFASGLKIGGEETTSSPGEVVAIGV